MYNVRSIVLSNFHCYQDIYTLGILFSNDVFVTENSVVYVMVYMQTYCEVAGQFQSDLLW